MNDIHLLAFETSGAVCSVALLSWAGGHVHLDSLRHVGLQTHAEFILPMAQELLVRAALDRGALSAVAFGQGPGSFTGLRIGCGVAQGLAFARSIPVIPVDSLCAIAAQSDERDAAGVHVVLQDARMNEIYAGVYRGSADRWVALQAPALLARADIAQWVARSSADWAMQAGGHWLVHGDALQVFEGLADEMVGQGGQLADGQAVAQADTVARLALPIWRAGGGLDAQFAAPAYVRDRVAYTTHERAQGLGGNPAVGGAMRTIHRMGPADLDEVAAIERHVQAFPWTRQNFADSLAAGQRGWVVRQMGAMHGFALLLDAPDMAHLLVIGVRPDVQRQGVGTQLLQTCLAHCRHAGLPALTLEVRQSNEQAIQFYVRHGFRRVGLRRGYYPAPHGQREDAWLMTLFLQEDSP